MELFNSLKKRLETYQEPFKHWAIDKPLTDFAIKEVCNAEIANPIITIDSRIISKVSPLDEY